MDNVYFPVSTTELFGWIRNDKGGQSAAALGYGGVAVSRGKHGNALAGGGYGFAIATDHAASAAALGRDGHAYVQGRAAIAIATGPGGTARAESGGAIVLAAYDENEKNLLLVRTALVGEHGIEAGKTYRLNGEGEFEEVKEPKPK